MRVLASALQTGLLLVIPAIATEAWSRAWVFSNWDHNALAAIITAVVAAGLVYWHMARHWSRVTYWVVLMCYVPVFTLTLGAFLCAWLISRTAVMP